MNLRERPRPATAAATCLFVALSVAVTACAERLPEGVQEMIGGEWIEVPVATTSATGRRDGGTTHAVFRFDGGGRTLTVEVDVVVNPQATLRAGRWRLSGDGVAEEGLVEARSVRFLGGQGGTVSVGGRFFLTNERGERFRVTLDPRELEAPGPSASFESTRATTGPNRPSRAS